MELVQRQCTLSIKGMTCQSCVKNIESTVKTKPGVLDVSVDLAAETGRFLYDPTVTAEDIIVGYIEDMGFDAVPSNPSSPRMSKCYVTLLQSATKTTLTNARGVEKVVTVENAEHLGQVHFDSSLITQREIQALLTEETLLQEANIKVQSVNSQMNVKTLEAKLSNIPGVFKVSSDDDGNSRSRGRT